VEGAVQGGARDSIQPNGTQPDKPQDDGNLEHRAASDSESASQQSKSPVLPIESSPNPVHENASRLAGNNTLGVDIRKAQQHHDDDIYDATPRLNNEPTSDALKAREIVRTVSDDSLAEKAKVKEVPKGKGFTAELEDTADAHQRRVRLAAQEEKIWLDPEDDPNYQPQMSATSYPGQEWNPYGDPDFFEE
jgi:hypothetical protein